MGNNSGLAPSRSFDSQYEGCTCLSSRLRARGDRYEPAIIKCGITVGFQCPLSYAVTRSRA